MTSASRSELNYEELEYLACVEDQQHVDNVIERLSNSGIPVRVQSVSIRCADEAPNCTYRLFVPQSSIDLARGIAFNGAAPREQYPDAQATDP
jgi:hypothetical protein